ncbi:hypothetical protein EYV94_17015 [Puteibacter caeruleilacunae]|nr:hypothetical protein EYV94_17015 [Puteibacter caeruleilacunae]
MLKLFVSLWQINNKSEVKLGKKIIYLIIISFIYLGFYSSCANQGIPSGGPKDSIPPELTKASPDLGELNFDGDEVVLTFNEFVAPERLNEKLVVSPPMKQKPTYRMKGKSIIVTWKDTLKENVTYSFDFKDAIEDNNEGNPIKDFRIAFSTGDQFDTLKVRGHVLKAKTLEPMEEVTVMLYKNLEDSAFIKELPDYIGKTDEEGWFTISNVPKATYKLYALKDLNQDYKYNPGLEEMAFLDSVIIPDATFSNINDTIIRDQDTIVVTGKATYLPEPLHLLTSTEYVFNQYLDGYKRDRREKVYFAFSQPVSEVFNMELLDVEHGEDWKYEDWNLEGDSVNVWIKDTLLTKKDTLNFLLTYQTPDSLGNPIVKKDTLMMLYTLDRVKSKKKKKKRKKKVAIPMLNPVFNTSNKFDIYNDLTIMVDEPLEKIDKSMIHLEQQVDTVRIPVDYTLTEDSVVSMKYNIHHEWEAEGTYFLSVDSAAMISIYGKANKPSEQSMVVQKEEHYGSIPITLTNVLPNSYILLLEGSDTEEELQRIKIDEDGEVTFPYLSPGRYKIKIFVDENGNGVWDNGSFLEKRQPEKVLYFNKVIPVRSNWDVKEEWIIDWGKITDKSTLTPPKEEKDKKRRGSSSRSRPSGRGGLSSF